MMNGLFLLAWSTVLVFLAYKAGQSITRTAHHDYIAELRDDLDYAVDVMRNQRDIIHALTEHVDKVDEAWQADRDRLTAKGL